MSARVDPAGDVLERLGRRTLAAAPAPPAPVVLHILADRRGAEIRSRRLLAWIAAASCAPAPLLLAALLAPLQGGGVVLALVGLGATVAAGIAALAAAIATGRPGPGPGSGQTRRPG